MTDPASTKRTVLQDPLAGELAPGSSALLLDWAGEAYARLDVC